MVSTLSVPRSDAVGTRLDGRSACSRRIRGSIKPSSPGSRTESNTGFAGRDLLCWSMRSGDLGRCLPASHGQDRGCIRPLHNPWWICRPGTSTPTRTTGTKPSERGDAHPSRTTFRRDMPSIGITFGSGRRRLKSSIKVGEGWLAGRRGRRVRRTTKLRLTRPR